MIGDYSEGKRGGGRSKRNRGVEKEFREKKNFKHSNKNKAFSSDILLLPEPFREIAFA